MNGKSFESVGDLVGATPLLALDRLGAKLKLNARILAKLEFFNPAGSVKDRVARAMLDAAERDGSLHPGATVIEPTSGNTGIALAALGAARGYRVIVVMPESMSEERKKLVRAFGAELVLTEAGRGMAGAIDRAKQLNGEIPGSLIMGQFENPANPDAHREGTGPEIFADADGRVDVLVAGVGTGGTITGTGEYLKERNPALRIVAVEPADSPVLSGGKPGPHKIQGIGAGFVPANLKLSLLDAVAQVTTEEAFQAARLLAATEGILAGISSGAALACAIAEAGKAENAGKTIVTILPDGGDRYLSTDLYAAD